MVIASACCHVCGPRRSSGWWRFTRPIVYTCRSIRGVTGRRRMDSFGVPAARDSHSSGRRACSDDALERDPRRLPRTIGSMIANGLKADFSDGVLFADVETVPTRRPVYRTGRATPYTFCSKRQQSARRKATCSVTKRRRIIGWANFRLTLACSRLSAVHVRGTAE